MTKRPLEAEIQLCKNMRLGSILMGFNVKACTCMTKGDSCVFSPVFNNKASSFCKSGSCSLNNHRWLGCGLGANVHYKEWSNHGKTASEEWGRTDGHRLFWNITLSVRYRRKQKRDFRSKIRVACGHCSQSSARTPNEKMWLIFLRKLNHHPVADVHPVPNGRWWHPSPPSGSGGIRVCWNCSKTRCCIL